MKLQHIALVCLLALSAGNVTAQMLHRPDSMYTFTDPRLQKKHPWRAAAETFGMNVGVWAFDRYVMNEDFAKISIGSIRRNIKHGFVWDNDQFSTNLFAHPYHGNLYFNAARSNGLTFWESAPYAFAGSLMWEIAAEVEPPAINDLMATTLGGIALGEVTHRMSSLILDDSKRGFSRFTREFLGTLICPMRGLNRMITGEMWKVKRSHYKYHDYDRIPVHFSIGAGDRYLADDNYLFRGEHNPYLEFRVQYGDAFDKVNDGPYDYFTARATFGLSGNQPLISQINLMGKLWGVPLKTTTGMEMMFGIFQHFNYFDSEEVIDGSGRIPYKISEAASVGPGMIYKFPRMNSLVNLEQRVFLSAILLGGSLTDYYNVIDRNYNMGSGYSIRLNGLFTLQRRFGIYLGFENYHIFTWKGYEHKDYENMNPHYLDAQGAVGDARLQMMNLRGSFAISPKVGISAETAWCRRKSHYKYFPDVLSDTFEFRLMFSYHI